MKKIISTLLSLTTVIAMLASCTNADSSSEVNLDSFIDGSSAADSTGDSSVTDDSSKDNSTTTTTTSATSSQIGGGYVIVTDQNGNVVTDESGNVVTSQVPIIVTDISGNIVTDDNGNVVTSFLESAVTDVNGNTVTSDQTSVVTDENGNTVTDESGNVVTVPVISGSTTPPASTTTPVSSVTTVKAGGVMYAKLSTYLYAENASSSATIAQVSKNTKVTIKGKCDNGWYAVEVNGKTGYMPASALGDSEVTSVTTTTKVTTTTSKTTTSSKTTTTTTKKTTTSRKTTTTSKKTTTTPKTTTTAKKTTTTTTTTKKAGVPANQLSDSQMRSYANEIVELVNEFRAENGVAPLSFTWDSKLNDAAQIRAEECVVSFSHNRPDGSSCFTALDECGITSEGHWRGENIAAVYGSPAKVVEAWKNSEGHRANMLSANYTNIGIGVYYNSDTEYRYYWTQMFYTP